MLEWSDWKILVIRSRKSNRLVAPSVPRNAANEAGVNDYQTRKAIALEVHRQEM
jgi:hypothetical protein